MQEYFNMKDYDRSYGLNHTIFTAYQEEPESVVKTIRTNKF